MDTIWRAAKTAMTRVLQPFQKAWTPTGAATFTPVEIKQFKMKADLEEYPDDLEESWLGFLASNNLDRKTWPFIRWFVEELILPQIIEDWEMNEVYDGVAAAPTPGVPGPISTSMDGIGKILADGILATTITPITTGVLETDPKLFVAQVEDMVKQIDNRYRYQPMYLAMDVDKAALYEEGFDLTYNSAYRQDTNNNQVKYTRTQVVGVHSMQGKSRMWATPKFNAIRLMKKSQNMGQVRIENVDRLVKLFTDFYSGVGFIFHELVFCNEQV